MLLLIFRNSGVFSSGRFLPSSLQQSQSNKIYLEKNDADFGLDQPSSRFNSNYDFFSKSNKVSTPQSKRINSKITMYYIISLRFYYFIILFIINLKAHYST